VENDGNMRRTKESKILQRLTGGGLLDPHEATPTLWYSCHPTSRRRCK